MINKKIDSDLTTLLRAFIIDGKEFDLPLFQRIHGELGHPFDGESITSESSIKIAKMYIYKLFEGEDVHTDDSDQETPQA